MKEMTGIRTVMMLLIMAHFACGHSNFRSFLFEIDEIKRMIDQLAGATHKIEQLEQKNAELKQDIEVQKNKTRGNIIIIIQCMTYPCLSLHMGL